MQYNVYYASVAMEETMNGWCFSMWFGGNLAGPGLELDGSFEQDLDHQM